MKKIILVLISIFILASSNVFATTQYLEFISGEQDDGSIYLDSYEDYENALKDVDEQELYKKEYEDMLERAIIYYEMTEAVDIVEAKVTETKEIVETYFYNEYGVTKIKYQPITIEILEGSHKGEIKEASYILTADSYENLKIKAVKPNQKINVIFEGEDVYATTVDAAIIRFDATIILILLTLIFISVYLGKEGLKLLPQLILLVDLTLLIFVPEILEGRSILGLTIITSLLYMLVETIIKVGLNAKTISAITSSTAVILTTTLGLLLFGSIANFSGITFDATNMIEAFPKGTINFYLLYISSFILMSTIIVSDISCETVNLYEKEVEKYAKPKAIEYVSNKIPMIFGILLITIIPKLLYTLVVKYSLTEILNSEILTTEIVRILFLIIAATLTTQVAAYTKKLFVEEKKK